MRLCYGPGKRVRDGKRREALKGQSHERLCKLVMRSLEDRLGEVKRGRGAVGRALSG